MKNKTMLEIAIEIISEDTEKSFKFMELFEKVEEQLKEKWEKDFVNEDNDYEKIRTKKMGELYRLLTVDRRFSRNSDETWTSSTFEVY
ncbi:DNA-directed RNA polymerase subunit delta [Mycoplasmopsis glycophila]|uniref:HTH HARE-type domain-containing protein n=1 Tax=Mycoplasmopsis glycophila TaxID=171285 RepID=A0A449AUV9_9BACT|nr:hypothetical protein [Mycoplasmopsis glycophila]VEU70262.1 Uncharacterised protein [Mycoplasmopsis glycophila]